MEIEMFKSNKGKDKMMVNGYAYCVEKTVKNNFYWCCCQKKSHDFKGRAVTKKQNGEIVLTKEPSQHSHSPNSWETEVCRANNSIKSIARTSDAAPSQIIRDSIVQTSNECRVYLPSKMAQKTKIYRARYGNLIEPSELADIHIPDHLRYCEGELFVLKETDFNNQKIIILGTHYSLKILSESECWLMDGTFHVVPLLMRQLFSIHGKVEHQCVPLIFCLMSGNNVILSSFTNFAN